MERCEGINSPLVDATLRWSKPESREADDEDEGEPMKKHSSEVHLVQEVETSTLFEEDQESVSIVLGRQRI